MSHTPGPWRIVGEGIMAGLPDKDGRYTRDTQVLPFYCCDSKSQTGMRHAADARLIAAAPELLDSLRQCQSWLREYHTQHGSPMDDGLFALDEQVSEAIAKATGQ